MLYGVVAIMQYVKTPTFSSNVDVLMGAPSQARVFNWCSNTVQVVFLVPTETTVRDPKTIQELCNIAYSSYQANEVAGFKWSPYMKSMNEKGEEITIEADPTESFLKQGSLIYKADSLKSKLSKMGLVTK